jgi:glycosyltransferase involved in cell wall biosynthesis
MNTPAQQTVERLSNDNPPRRRRWSINGRFLSRNMTGVDRYALEIVRGMDALIGAGHPLAAGLTLDILCPAGATEASPFANIPVRYLQNAPGHLWEQFLLPAHVRGGLLSLCNVGPLAVKKQIVCMHDTNNRLVPESYSLLFRTAYRLLQPALGRRAARIVTVSRFSQETIGRFGIRPADDIEVIHNGYEHVLEWEADRSALDGFGLPRPFVLLVGSKAPHKNVAIIYSIAADLATKGIHVVVAGGGDANVYARERNGQLPPNVKHLGRVEDNDLAFLYQNALCLGFPSRTEGFGLTPLEAMALGCPVISSDAASLPEVCGEAALYAPPDDGAAWLAAIGQIAAEPTLRERLASAGRQRAKKFSWRKGAEKYLELMLALEQSDREKRRA